MILEVCISLQTFLGFITSIPLKKYIGKGEGEKIYDDIDEHNGTLVMTKKI